MAFAAAATLVPIAMATPAAEAADPAGREEAQTWSGVFDALRPVPALDARRVLVVFEAPSLAEWSSAAKDGLTPRQERAFTRRARADQSRQLERLRQGGVQFTVQHRYLRVLNGAALVVHGDDAQRLHGMDGVRSVSQVRAVYPARFDWQGRAAGKAGASSLSADFAARAAVNVSHGPSGAAHPTVAVLDTGIDFNHPALAGRQAGPGYDVLAGHTGVEPGDDDSHGTEVAGGVAIGAGDAGVRMLPVRVLDRLPVLGGYEATVGTTDALLAGFEFAVDPNQDGSTTDRADVALAALSVPYAGFTDAPEERAVRGAFALGTITVAAAGNDGASGDATGTVGGPAAARDALAVGAADLRKTAASTDVHARGGVLDSTWSGAPLLTSTPPPGESRPVIAVEGSGADVVHYLGDDARSRVGGAIVLLDRHAGVSLADQVRAAGDAGAAVVLVSGASSSALAGVVTGRGTDVPAVGISSDAGASLRQALKASSVEVGFDATVDDGNVNGGTVAGFSARGPRYDGIGKPDLVAAGVGVRTSTTGAGENAYAQVSGSSIAAALVAGQVAAVRAAHPGWTPQRLRSALIGTAQPLGTGDARESLEAQGAGVPDVAAAAAATVVAEPARVDFGIVTPGAGGRSALSFLRVRTGKALELPALTSERSGDSGPLPSVDGGELVVAVPEGTQSGVYGGWLVNERDGVRVPWMVVVRQPDEFNVPVSATISDASFSATDVPGQFPSSVQLALGGSSTAGSLGLRAAQAVELRLVGPKGGDLGALGRLDYVLPGVYTLGLTGRAADGTMLKAGEYDLQVRVRSAALPGGDWVEGPRLAFSVDA